MQNLAIPYHSQWDPDANVSKDDCGPACLSMIFDFYGRPSTTNDIFNKTGAAIDALIGVDNLLVACNAMGFTANYKTALSVNDIKTYLDNGTPVIALIHNGDLSSREDMSDIGGHFVVVVGYRDDGYFVNDPDFWGQFRQDGDHHFYTKADFEKAWADCHLDNNPDNSLLIVDAPPKGTFIDDVTFTKLVGKSSNLDKIGKFLNFTQPQIDDPTFGDVAIARLTTLNEMAFGNKSTIVNPPTPPEATSETAQIVPQTTPASDSTPQQPNLAPNLPPDTVSVSKIKLFFQLLADFFNIKEVSN